MTKNHENKLTMYMAVQAVLEENAEKTATVPAMVAPIQRFTDLINGIQTKAKEFDSVAAGKTKVKNEAEDVLMDELIPAVSALSAYAHTAGDTALAVKSGVPEYTIRRLRDTEIIAKANGLLELLEANAGALSEYCVTSDTLAAIRQKIDAYAGALGKKESGFSERVGVRHSLLDLFDEADRVLGDLLDSLMEQFRKREPEFYDEYFQARFIKQMGAPRKVKPAPVAEPAK